MPGRKRANRIAAAIKAMRSSLGPIRPGKFQNIADALAANRCSIKDFQEAAIIMDDLLMWEQEISEITWRVKGLPERFTYRELLTHAAAAGDQAAKAMLDAGIPEMLEEYEY